MYIRSQVNCAFGKSPNQPMSRFIGEGQLFITAYLAIGRLISTFHNGIRFDSQQLHFPRYLQSQQRCQVN